MPIFIHTLQIDGNWNNGLNAGTFTLNANNAPDESNQNIGTRLYVENK